MVTTGNSHQYLNYWAVIGDGGCKRKKNALTYSDIVHTHYSSTVIHVLFEIFFLIAEQSNYLECMQPTKFRKFISC